MLCTIWWQGCLEGTAMASHAHRLREKSDEIRDSPAKSSFLVDRSLIFYSGKRGSLAWYLLAKAFCWSSFSVSLPKALLQMKRSTATLLSRHIHTPTVIALSITIYLRKFHPEDVKWKEIPTNILEVILSSTSTTRLQIGQRLPGYRKDMVLEVTSTIYQS